MAKFDETKDETLAIESFEAERGTTIELKVSKYDGGEPKMQLTRFADTEENGRRYMKLGRLTAGEARMLYKKICELLLSSGMDNVDSSAQ